MDFYSYTYPEINTVSPARLLLSVQDSAPFNVKWNDVWKSKHLYNYEAQFSMRPKEEVQKLIRNDLQKMFPYQVTSMEQEMDCWVLTLLNKEKLQKFPKDLKYETNIYEESGLPIYLINCPLSFLLKPLESLYKVPFIDETGLEEEPIKLDLPANLLDIKELKASLKAQGLLLEKVKRKVKTVTISD